MKRVKVKKQIKDCELSENLLLLQNKRGSFSKKCKHNIHFPYNLMATAVCPQTPASCKAPRVWIQQFK